MKKVSAAERKAAFQKVFVDNGFNLGGKVGNRANAGKDYKRPYSKTKRSKGEDK